MNYYNYNNDDNEEEQNYYLSDYDEDDENTFQIDEDGNIYDLYGNYIKEQGE